MFKTIFRKRRNVYLDYAASTPVERHILKSMKPYWRLNFGNAGSLHTLGVISKSALSNARNKCAKLLNAHEDEIIFTGGGTESNNLAIFGIINKLKEDGLRVSNMHFITSRIEHPSVRDIFKNLEKQGAYITHIKVDDQGFVDPVDIRESLNSETVLVSIMTVNNEIGSIEPIKKIAKEIRLFRNEKKEDNHLPYFHTDASQSWILPSINVEKFGVNLLTLDAQKLYGPKGVGLLYKKRNVEMKQFVIGGNQELKLRPGTENIPLIVGFAKAFELVRKSQEKESVRLSILRDYFIVQLQKTIPNVELNGPGGKDIDRRTPNNVNISIPGINNEFVVIALDERGISCGTRSSCVGNNGEPSYVIKSLGKTDEVVKGSLRFTLGKFTKRKDIDYTVKALYKIVKNFDNFNN